MRTLTIRDVIKNLPKTIKAAYGWNMARDVTPGNPAREVVKVLEGMDLETATMEGIRSVIGDMSVCITPRCHECYGEFDAVVVLDGDMVDREDSFHICESCIRRALSQICTIKQE